MSREIAKQLVEYGKEALNNDFRTVVCYGRNHHDPIYLREDVRTEIEATEREAFRIPTWQFHRSALHISRLFEGRGEPEVITRSYEDHHVLQFPLSEMEGILFSFDSTGEIPEDLLVGCKSIVHGECDSNESLPSKSTVQD